MSQADTVMTAVAPYEPKKRRVRIDRIISIAVIAPSIIAIAIFVYFFIGASAYISVIDWNQSNYTNKFVGLQNYQQLFSTFRFQQDLRNTLFFTIAFLVVCLAIGLLLAILLDQKVKGEAIFRNIFMFPLAISFIVTGVAWRWLLSPGTAGDPHGVDQLFNLDPLTWTWFSNADSGIFSVALAAVWQMSGYVMAMYIAGLRAIPDEIREAARVDGATEWQVFRSIIFPLLQPITLSAVIILGHISLKIFDLVFAMSGHGPAFGTDVPALNMFDTIAANEYSSGAAIAMILLILVSILIIPYLIFNFRNEVKQ